MDDVDRSFYFPLSGAIVDPLQGETYREIVRRQVAFEHSHPVQKDGEWLRCDREGGAVKCPLPEVHDVLEWNGMTTEVIRALAPPLR